MFLVPILFPPKRPSEAVYLEHFQQKIPTKYEWILKYELPFKPSCIWKRLFLRLRNVAAESQQTDKVSEEHYWVDGCFFRLQKLLVEAEMSEHMQTSNKRFSYVMQVRILTPKNPQQVYVALKEEVGDYLFQWLNNSFVENIRFSLVRKSLQFDPPKMMHKLERKQPRHRGLGAAATALCAYCGLELALEESLERCENCMTKNFLIEKSFALAEVVSAGGFGRIFKAFHRHSGRFVSIKERKEEGETYYKLWKDEIAMLHRLEKETEMMSARVVCVLEESRLKIPQKFIVLEWIEGGNLLDIENHVEFLETLQSEESWLRMFLVFLSELSKLHSIHVAHRDIKVLLN